MGKITCSDCGAAKGTYHKEHCDIERCPNCGLQLFSCDCVFPQVAADGSFLLDRNKKKFFRFKVRTAVDM